MKKHYKLPLLLVASTTLVTPLIVCAKQVDNNSTKLDTELNIIKYDKVVFKSDITGVKFEGKTIIKVKDKSYFAGIQKPIATLEGYEFEGWYKESTFDTKWEDTTPVTIATDDPIYVYPRFTLAKVDYSVTVSGKQYSIENPLALYSSNPSVMINLQALDGSGTETLTPATWGAVNH